MDEEKGIVSVAPVATALSIIVRNRMVLYVLILGYLLRNMRTKSLSVLIASYRYDVSPVLKRIICGILLVFGVQLFLSLVSWVSLGRNVE